MNSIERCDPCVLPVSRFYRKECFNANGCSRFLYLTLNIVSFDNEGETQQQQLPPVLSVCLLSQGLQQRVPGRNLLPFCLECLNIPTSTRKECLCFASARVVCFIPFPSFQSPSTATGIHARVNRIR